MESNIKKYLNYPFTQMIKRVEDEEDGIYYLGRYLEIPEARTHGDTIDELERRMEEVLELSIELRLKNGEEIPEPFDNEDFSGKFTLRLPKSLHKELSLAAKEENVSLNQYAVYQLSKSIGK